MRKYIIILCGIILSILFAGGCGEETSGRDVFSAVQNLSENAAAEQRMEFISPAIEERTRELLDKPEGVIMKADVLAITEFEFEIGEEPDHLVTPFMDLQWYRDLEYVKLSFCGVQSLDGVEKLTSLRRLYVRDGDITNIEQIKELTGLVEFCCSGNPVTDYSAVGELVNLEKLWMGDNGASYLDLTPLKKLTKLTDLYAPWSGISDISVLDNLTELSYLNLFHNEISDVSALEGLSNLTYLELGINEITDIEPLRGLCGLTHLNLHDNPVSDETLAAFYEEKQKEQFTVTQTGRLRGDMPEFTFELSAYYDLQMESYALQTLVVRDGDEVLQTISIPELTFFGQTSVYDEETLGFSLEDMNFDGYQDVRLYDTMNGNYRSEYIYLIWNPTKRQFERDARLNEISLATFDQEKQLIYGMERGGAAYHYFSTYQYINGEIVKICYEEEEGLLRANEEIRQYYDMAELETDATYFDGFYHHVMERNAATGELETTVEEYVFYPLNVSDDGTYKEGDYLTDEILHVDVSSKLGKFITEDDEYLHSKRKFSGFSEKNS